MQQVISLDSKKTTTGFAAHLALVRGMKALAELVGITLGPQGCHVMLAHRAGLAPLVSKDGVEVARHLSLPDSEEELGVRLLRNAAVAVSESFGDGTSTATVFTADLAERALKLISAGADTLEVRRGLGLAAYAALIALNDMARCADRGMLTSVALTAANGDRRVADLLVEAFESVGAEGTIDVEMGSSVEDVLEVVQGSYFDTVPLVRALLPPTGQLELARPLILFHCDAIDAVDEILPALEVARSSRRPLLILADSVGTAVETLLVRNQNEGTLAVAAVRAPMYGDTRREALLDLTSKFGGTAFGQEGFVEFALRPLRSLSEGDLGQADEAVLETDGVTLRGAGNSPFALEDRIALVRAELERGDGSVGGSPSAKLDYIEKRRERLKLLAAGSAKLHIGGATDVEIKTRLPLAENAHRALLAAAKSGVLPGGGVAMIRAAEKVQREMGQLEGDVAAGAAIFLQSLDTPIRWIARNAGMRPDEVLTRTLAHESDFYGRNAMTGRYGDLAEDGVLDALEMVTDVIRVAVSVVGSMLGVGALVTRAAPKPAPERFKGTARVHDKLMREGGFDE